MKVKFLKKHKMGSNSFEKGDKALLIPSIAEQLIDKGVCEENNYVTLRDKIVEAQAEENENELKEESVKSSTKAKTEVKK